MTTSSAPAQPTQLLGHTNVWSYNQTDNLDGTGWEQPGFDDSAWPSGPGLLGVENSNPDIIVRIQTPLTLGRLTYYFRTHFTVPSDAFSGALRLSARIDDGAVVYLNGSEAGRVRMPYATVHHESLAIAGSPEVADDVLFIDGTYLVIGENVMAVEIHQATTNSTDVFWGCSLEAMVGPPEILLQPQSQTVLPERGVTLSALAGGTPPLSYQWYWNGDPIAGATQSSLVLSNFTFDQEGDYHVVVNNALGAAASLTSRLTVSYVIAWGSGSAVTNLPPALSNVLALSAGWNYSLALKRDGSVVACCTPYYAPPSAVAHSSNIVAIDAGLFHGLALKSDGTVVAWGGGSSGVTNVPTDLRNVVAIAAGGNHDLALKSDGTVVAWGVPPEPFNFGQAVVPAGLRNVVGIAVGAWHSVALKYDGTVVAWGDNRYGQASVPAGLNRVVAVSAGGEHSLALKQDGTVVAWGLFASGYLPAFVPPGLSNVVAISAGRDHDLALQDDGTVVAWGYNASGQTNVPAGLSNIVAITGGYTHSLALVAHGPPFFTVSPWNQRTYPGGRVTLRAMAGGDGPLSYQWQLNGANLPGATNASLNLPNVQFSQAGRYRVVVSNGLGTATSTEAVLSVADMPPEIDAQPSNQESHPGGTATFQVAAEGSRPLSYQWRFEGSDVVEATNATLVLTDVQPAQVGNYSVVVRNACGERSSANAALFFSDSLPVITRSPESQARWRGEAASLAVSAASASGLSYQWQCNGTNLLRATNAFLAMTAVEEDQSGLYRVVVSNAYGAVTSVVVRLTVMPLRVVAWGWPTNVPTNLTLVTAVAAGSDFGLALRRDGTVAAWAENTNYCDACRVPADLRGVAAIAAGAAHSLAVRHNGAVVAWGSDYGPDNEGNQNNPVFVGQATVPSGLASPLGGAVAVAAGAYHSLALKVDGSVVAWGWNRDGQTDVPPGLTDAVAIAAGMNFSVALKRDGTVVVWGAHWYGQTNVPAYLSPPVGGVVAIAAGEHHILAIRADGTVVAWGDNYYGQTNVPVGLSNVVAVAAAGHHSLALRIDGTVIAWGENGAGQCLVPPEINNVIAIAAGKRSSLALVAAGLPRIYAHPQSVVMTNGGVATLSVAAVGLQPLSYQWQRDGLDIAGATNSFLTLTNVQAGDIGNYRVVVRNAVEAVTSAKARLTVLSWFVVPSEMHSVLGSLYPWRATNIHAGITNAVAIGAEYFTTVLVKADGTVMGWGIDDEFDRPWYSHAVSGFSNMISAVRLGGEDFTWTVGLKNDGTVMARPGGLGTPPRPLQGLAEVVAIAGQDYHFAALKRDGTVVDYRVHDSAEAEWNSTMPSEITQAVAIAAGDEHLVVLQRDGTVVELWSGTNAPSDLTNAIAVAAGRYHSLALTRDGTVVAWGANDYGQCHVPLDLTNVVAITADAYRSYALIGDGTVRAWGGITGALGLTHVVAMAGGYCHLAVLKGDGQPLTTTAMSTRTAFEGEDVFLVAQAASRLPVAFQWQKNGMPIDGATNCYLYLEDVRLDEAGFFTVIVSNALATVTGQTVLLTVNEGPPRIVKQPVEVVTFPGGTAQFEVEAEGSQPLHHQWSFEGADVPGATNITLVLEAVSRSQAGRYAVRVTNSFGAATSQSASLAIVPVAAWGNNSYGQCDVPGDLTNVVAIAAGSYHSLALKTDGSVAAWGANWYGQTTVPAGLGNIVAIAAEWFYSLALKADGSVAAWGANWSGETVVTAGLTNVVAIAGSENHSLMLKSDGTVIGWQGLSNVVAIAAGYDHNLALRNDGTVVASGGYNRGGELDVPSGLSNVVAISAGGYHSLALKNDGTVVAWGSYHWGPYLGYYTPITVPSGLTNVVAVAAGFDSSLALISDGTIIAWGWARSGQTNVPTGLSNVVALACQSGHALALVGTGSPTLTVQPVTRTVIRSAELTLCALAAGAVPLRYQWRLNGLDLPDATNATLRLPSAQLADSGNYSVVVNNSLGAVTSQVAKVTVLVPPSLDPLPASASALRGSSITFTVDATGTPPLRYQWRRNGVNIQGATNSWLTITNVQVSDGGSYSVVVANIVGAVTSDPMLLIVEVPQVPPGDNFTNRVALSGVTNSIGGTNRWATRETGEPFHAGKYGSNSIWYQWTAPASGIATFRTVGSTFDTLLGVYTNDLSLNPQPSTLNLVAVESDEDRGGYLTSEARFNAVEGVEYQIAIDGLAGQQGTFILSWDVDVTAEVLPVITNPPVSRTVVPGSEATFSVRVSGTDLTYQWYFNGAAMADATNTTLTLSNVSEADVGFYTVRVRNVFGREVESLPAALEIGLIPRRVGTDKLEDLFEDGGVSPAPWRGGGKSGAAGFASPSPSGFISVSMGTIDYQIGSTTNAQSQAWEPNHCGVLGGASVWYDFQAEAAGTLAIDTMGSRFDTVLAVYRRTNLVNLAANNVACDDNSAPDGVRSRVVFETGAGARYWVVVDGVNAARGRVKLNWCLGRAPEVASTWTNAMVARGSNVTLQVTVTNAVPAAQYQWYRNGQVLTGATNRTLGLTNMEPAQAGYYSVLVSNAIAAVEAWVGYVELEPVWVPMAQSGFAGGDDGWGWGAGDLGGGAPGSGWQMGGFLQVRASRVGERWWWRAPRSYGGNPASAYGGWLQFDLKQTVPTNRPVVWLYGASGTLSNRCASKVGTNWTTYRLSLREEAGWQRLDGRPALPGELRWVLASLEALEIEGRFGAANDACELDNVQFLAPCTDDSPPLRIESTLAGAVLLWPAEAGCYQLEATGNLGAPDWTTNFTVVSSVLTNGWQRVTMDLSLSNRFFRLHKP